jgi:phage regulator Rha-like protein
MSSREIAELTGKRHDNVKSDIEKLLKELNLNAPEFSGTYIATNGNKALEYNLPKRECLILISGYSVSLRAKIIDRWQELENKNYYIPQTYSEALQLCQHQIKTAKCTVSIFLR